MHPDIIKAFMATTKVKRFKLSKTYSAQVRALQRNPEQKDRIMSYEHIRKFHDAMLFGASEKGVNLSGTYLIEMKKFLDNYKKEVASKKKEGAVDESNTDPFTFPLYRLVANWFIKENNLFSWLFIIFQWNCMARSISIDHIGFTNMKRGTDSIIVKYDETKSDKTGERCTNKNVYANLTDPSICFFTALGIYCSYESVSLITREGIFLKENAKLGTAAHRFCNSLQKLIENYAEVVDGYVRSTHTNTHGIRKGSATYSTSGTTVPPSLISVALRGEWSMGKVFDVYFNFGECGDNYLGRILAGLDPNSTNFGDLPPYFKKDMNDDVIKQGMTCMYGDLLKSHPNSVSILLLCFASVIYHIEFIKEGIDKNPGHIFSTLPLLQDEELLQKLKRLITREPSAMMNVTGVPPHIMQLKILDSIKTRLEDITSQFTQQSGQIIQTVRDAIFANDLQSGTLNLATLENKLNEHTNSVEKIIEKVFETRGFNQSTTMAQQVIETGSRQELFSYDNRFYAVPKGFQSPKNMKLKQAWLCWRQGFPYYCQKENDKIKIVSIKPFRQIKPTLLPKKVQIQFRNDLKPILFFI